MGDLKDILIEKFEKEMISRKDAESIFYEFPQKRNIGKIIGKFGFPIFWMTLNANKPDWNKLSNIGDMHEISKRYKLIPKAGIVTTKAFFLSNEYGIEKNINEFLDHSRKIFKEPKFYNIDFFNKQNIRYLKGDSQILTIQRNDEKLNLGRMRNPDEDYFNVFELFVKE